MANLWVITANQRRRPHDLLVRPEDPRAAMSRVINEMGEENCATHSGLQVCSRQPLVLVVVVVHPVAAHPPLHPETTRNGSVLATDAVETQGKGSVLATDAVETQGKGSVLPVLAAHDPEGLRPCRGRKRSALNTAKGAAVAAHTPTQMEQDGEVRQPMPAL